MQKYKSPRCSDASQMKDGSNKTKLQLETIKNMFFLAEKYTNYAINFTLT